MEGAGAMGAGAGTGVSITGSGVEVDEGGEVLAVGSFPCSGTVSRSDFSVKVGLQSSWGGRARSVPCLGFHWSAALLNAVKT